MQLHSSRIWKRPCAATTVREAKLRGNIEALRPWQTLDLPLDLGETVRTRISLGMLPAAVDLAEAAKDAGGRCAGVAVV